MLALVKSVLGFVPNKRQFNHVCNVMTVYLQVNSVCAGERTGKLRGRLDTQIPPRFETIATVSFTRWLSSLEDLPAFHAFQKVHITNCPASQLSAALGTGSPLISITLCCAVHELTT